VSYTIEWKPSARKEIRKLDPAVRRRVIEAVTALGAEPRPPGSVTLTGSPGWRRIPARQLGAVASVTDRSSGFWTPKPGSILVWVRGCHVLVSAVSENVRPALGRWLSAVLFGCAGRDAVELVNHCCVEVDVADGKVSFEVVDGRGARDEQCLR